MITRQRLPYATLVVIAANIMAAFVLVFQPDYLFDFGFQPNDPSIKTAFTCLFLHQNVLHLLGNMVFLAAVGPAVELGAGTLRFLVVYFLGGFAGVAAHWYFAHKMGNSAPLIGASGCIAACIAYYALRYYHQKVKIWPIAVPVYAIILLWVVLQVLGAFVNLGSVQGGTAYWAHLGGLAMGIILSITFSAPKQAHVEQTRSVIGQMDTRSPAAKLAAANNFLKDNPDDLSALSQKADALSTLNEPEEEAQVLMHMLEKAPDPHQLEIFSKLDKINRLERLPSLKRTMYAEKYKNSSPDLSRLLLLSVIRVMDDKMRPDALYAMACLDIVEYPENAKTWLRDLLTTYPLHPAADLARAKDWKQ